MPTFVFTDPSGRTHEVTGPPGATQEQAFSILQQRLQSAPPEPPPQREPEATGMGERFLAGLADPIYGAAQLAEKTGIPGAIRKGLGISGNMDDVIRQREADYVPPEGVDWARMAGNIANPVNLAAPGAGFARAAAMGATQAALAPVDPDADFAAEKAKQAAFGGLTGGVLAKVLPRVIRPIKPTAEAEALQRQGVTLTPGQAAGGRLNTLEQKAMSWPVGAELIGPARTRALGDFEARAIERATGAAQGKGARTVQDANDVVSGMYQDVVPKLRATGESEVDVLGAVAKAADNPELTPGNLKILEGLHTKLFGHDGERYMKLDGPALKDLDAELGAKVRQYRKSPLPSDHVLADEIHNMQQAMRESWRYHLDTADADLLDAANRAYHQMLPINKAASARADQQVTPRALQKALARQAGKDVTRMPPDALVDPAVKVLSSTVPDSGTAGRLTTPTAIVSGINAPLSTLAAGLGVAAAYSRPGVKLLTGNTNVQRKLLKMTPAARKAFVAALRAQQAAEQEK